MLPGINKRNIGKEELLSAISKDSLEAVKYLYGFKAGMSKSTVQYLHIHIAFPVHYHVDDIVKRTRAPL
jgi:hypothetical protein